MGIDMDITTYVDSSSWDTKFAGMLLNGTLADLMLNMQIHVVKLMIMVSKDIFLIWLNIWTSCQT